MTKFDELCDVFTKAEKEFFEYRSECGSFARMLRNGLIHYLECKNEDIDFCELNENDSGKCGRAPEFAFELNDDTFWHFGLGINLYAESTKPRMLYIFDLGLKKEDNKFKLKILGNGKEFSIDPDSREDFKKIYDYIFDTIKNRFDNELGKFLNKEIDAEEVQRYIM